MILYRMGMKNWGKNTTKAQRRTLKEPKKKYIKVIFYIQHGVNSNNLEINSKVSKPKEVFDIVVKYYVGRYKFKNVKL